MRKIRAICVGDTRFDSCPVFELDTTDNKFKMIVDTEFQYDLDVILEDDDWMVFFVEDDVASPALKIRENILNQHKSKPIPPPIKIVYAERLDK